VINFLILGIVIVACGGIRVCRFCSVSAMAWEGGTWITHVERGVTIWSVSWMGGMVMKWLSNPKQVFVSWRKKLVWCSFAHHKK